MTLTNNHTYFDSFSEGDVFRHSRGKTITRSEMQEAVHMTMNTAEAHFNRDKMESSQHDERINYGGLTMSIVLGLASPDTTENARRITKLDEIRFQKPVYAGDTLYAASEVVHTDEDATDDPETGIIQFKHYGLNQNDETVFSGVQECIIRKAPGDQ